MKMIVNSPVFKIKSKLKVFPGKIAWYYCLVPREESKLINEMFSDQKRGWSSLPVRLSLGTSTWETSIFYMKKEESFMLPLKKEIRTSEGLVRDDLVEIKIKVIV